MHRRTFVKAGFFSLLASRAGFRSAKAAELDAPYTSAGIDGQVITVNGPIPSADLGVVLTHEHLLINHPSGVLSSTSTAVTQLGNYANEIASDSTILGTTNATVLSLTSRGLRWDNSGDSLPSGLSSYPAGLVTISNNSGVNIVMGSSYYKSDSFTHPSALDSMSIEDIEAEIVSDIESGVSGTGGIRSGYIGEVGISRTSLANPLTELEEKVLIASALAQARTGVGMSIHFDTSIPVADQDLKLSALGLCAAAGADPQRIVLCHCRIQDSYFLTTAKAAEFAKAGAYIGIDLLFDTSTTAATFATQISNLKDAGCLEKVLLSHDIYDVSQYASRSYDWVLAQVVSDLQSSHGFTNDDIQTLFVQNPRRLLAVRSGRPMVTAASWFGSNSPQNLVGSGTATSLSSATGHGSGTACSFNGSSSCLVVPHHPSFNPAHPFTVAFWMKAPTQPGSYSAVVDKCHGLGTATNLDVDYMGRSSVDSGWVMQLYAATHQLKFAVATGSTFYIAATSTSVTVCDDAWHHFAGVYTGDAIDMYMDGVLHDHVALSLVPLGNNRDLYIGRWGGGGRYFQGLLQDVTISAGVDWSQILMA